MRRWAKELSASDGWKEVRDGLEVKQCSGPDGKETLLLCRSRDRHSKVHAMHERAAEHIRSELGSLERHSRAARRFEVEVVYDLERKSEMRLQWTERKNWRQWAELTEGTYIVRTNVTDWGDEDLWRTYVQLWQAEAAIRTSKSDISLRPIWHQRSERVQAHILVCFPALCLWKTLEGWQSRVGLGNSPRTLLKELKRIQCVDVVLPIIAGPDLRLRCVVERDQDLASLLDPLGLRLPKRPRTPLRGAQV